MNNEELLSLFSTLISSSSVSGTEKRIVDCLDDIFHSLGFDTVRMESGSICGILDGRKDGPVILIDAHIDTVGVADPGKWSTDPFVLTKKDGKLYGRGASDMKGGLAAAIAGASSFRGRDFPGRIVVACVVEEERFEGICAREISSFFNPDFVIIGESTHGKLNIGQRGRCEITVVAEGKSCHSSNPEEGINAVSVMIDAIKAIEDMPLHEDEMLGKGIMVLTDIISSPYPGSSVLPEKCRATYDRRTLPGERGESVAGEINAVLSSRGIDAKAFVAMGETDTYTGLHLHSERFFPAWKYREDDEIAIKARRGLEEAGLWSGFGHYSFCTNASHYAGEKGIPTIGYGPGEERLAHIVDEYIEEEDLYRAKRGMEAIIKGLLGI